MGGLSKSELLAIEDTIDFVGTVIDSIWAKEWPPDMKTEAYRDFFLGLPKEQRVIWATWRLQAEVSNGGFGGYFANLEDNVFVEETIDGLRILGANELAAIFHSVLGYFDAHRDQIQQASDWDQYAEVMGYNAIEQNLDRATSRFLHGKDEFYAVRRRYILQHLDVFCDRP